MAIPHMTAEVFRAKLGRVADDFAEFVQNGAPVDVPAVGQLHQEPVDGMEVPTRGAVGHGHADMEDCGEGIQPPLKGIDPGD